MLGVSILPSTYQMPFRTNLSITNGIENKKRSNPPKETTSSHDDSRRRGIKLEGKISGKVLSQMP
jgi:hypothetical protein